MSINYKEQLKEFIDHYKLKSPFTEEDRCPNCDAVIQINNKKAKCRNCGIIIEDIDEYKPVFCD